MTDHDKAPHDELLAKLDKREGMLMASISLNNSEVCEVMLEVHHAAAAIRDLQAELETERNMYAEMCVGFDLEIAARKKAEQTLAKCFEETRERCAKVCNKWLSDSYNNEIHVVVSDITYAIRALTQEPAEPSAQNKDHG